MKAILLLLIIAASVGATWWLCSYNYSQKLGSAISIINDMDSNLQQSNQTLLHSNVSLAYEWQQRRYNPIFAEKAAYTSPKIDSIAAISASLYSHLEEVKSSLISKTISSASNESTDLNKNDGLVKEFIDNQKAKLVFDSITSFKSRLIGFLQPIELEKLSGWHNNSFLVGHTEYESWVNHYFTNASASTALASITQLQNDILRAANNVCEYFNQQISICGWSFFEKFEMLVSQNSTYLKAGDTLEIRAGVGAFSTSMKLIIKIDGITVTAEENSVGILRIPVSKSGRVPVSISFIDPSTGERNILTKHVEYHVKN